ncbi:Smr/MutS family protein [Desulfopila sp. IMCC35008]|uniref:Smr/MutS family protein n=1 Tax=Desulfopila sp. IMCC35008 TaxID=2653858 RepID=UPI0013CFCC41|nr:Smr/MutS family protein [Desulfopila sp. IMCC35008]
MGLCEVCGNDIPAASSSCRFCGSPQSGHQGVSSSPKKDFRRKVVNLERGMPAAEDAIRFLEAAISEARAQRISILTVIHGYGSSGKGGKIRRECHSILDYKCSKGELQDYLPGEDFSRRNGPTKSLLRRYPQLLSDRNLDRGNRGISLIIL